MKLLLSASLLFTILSAVPTCGRREIECTDQEFTISTVGYTVDEADTVIVRWFNSGTSFAQPFDSLRHIYTPTTYNQRGDTLWLSDLPHIYDHLHFTYHFDYEVYLPATARTYRISGLQHEGHFTDKIATGSSGDCKNKLVSYQLDGTTHTWPDFKAEVLLVK